ncbi:MAG: alpha/beta hydrolase [Acidobacteria bacterium]|nr:alpha/beta hydrolase [Acidobacteriota bacterium]
MLEYRIDGPQTGTPLVLLNGLFADINSWQSAMPFLAKRRVLRLNSRGQGGSPPLTDSDGYADQVADLVDLLTEIEWPVSDVVGVSHGGNLALSLAQDQPQRLRKVVAMGCLDQVTGLAAQKIGTWAKAHQVGGGRHRFDIASPWVWSDTFLSEHGEVLAFYRDRADQYDDNQVRHLLRCALAASCDPLQIHTPTLLMTGAEDVLTPTWSMAAMAQRFPNATFRALPDTAHASILEQPQVFETHILPFLESGHVG